MKRLTAALALLNVFAAWSWWKEHRARREAEKELRIKRERFYRGAIRRAS